jgi:hypothetical protein
MQGAPHPRDGFAAIAPATAFDPPRLAHAKAA